MMVMNWVLDIFNFRVCRDKERDWEGEINKVRR